MENREEWDMIGSNAQELEEALKRAHGAMREAWSKPAVSISDAEWQIALSARMAGHSPTQQHAGTQDFLSAFMESVECLYFKAKRAVILERFGLDDPPWPSQITVKDQPERLGVLIIALFRDRLAAVDSSYMYDALFLADETAEKTEVYTLLHFPQKAVNAWRAKVGKEYRSDYFSPENISEVDEMRATFKLLVRAKQKAKIRTERKNGGRAHITPKQLHKTLAHLVEANRLFCTDY